MQKQNVWLLVLVGVLLHLADVYSNPHIARTTATTTTTTARPTKAAVTRTGLCPAFRTLRDLIPANTFVEIIARHYQTDARFRNALKFMQTTELARIAAKLEDSAGYQQVLWQLERVCVDTADIISIADILDCLLMPSAMQQDAGNCTQPQSAVRRARPAPSARTMKTLVDELLDAIPRSQFRATLARLIAEDVQFARFYNYIRGSAFPLQVLNNLSSPQLAASLRTLRRHYIDLPQLFLSVMRVFSWGPSTNANSNCCALDAPNFHANATDVASG